MTEDYIAKPYRQRRAMMDKALSIYGYKCSICGGPITPGDESLEHVVARSRGGTDDEANLRPAHSKCNAAKGNREIDSRLVVYGGEELLIEWKLQGI